MESGGHGHCEVAGRSQQPGRFSREGGGAAPSASGAPLRCAAVPCPGTPTPARSQPRRLCTVFTSVLWNAAHQVCFHLSGRPPPVSCFCSASVVLGRCSAPQLCPHQGPCQLPGCDPFWLLHEHTPTLESHCVCSINAVSLGVCSFIVGRVCVHSDGLALGRVDV